MGFSHAGGTVVTFCAHYDMKCLSDSVLHARRSWQRSTAMLQWAKRWLFFVLNAIKTVRYWVKCTRKSENGPFSILCSNTALRKKHWRGRLAPPCEWECDCGKITATDRQHGRRRRWSLLPCWPLQMSSSNYIVIRDRASSTVSPSRQTHNSCLPLYGPHIGSTYLSGTRVINTGTIANNMRSWWN